MVAATTEAHRLAAVEAAATLGRLADGVVVAAMHWQSNGVLSDADRASLAAIQDWLGRLESVLSDPLDLARSLPGLSELTLLAEYGQRGDGLAALLRGQEKPGQPSEFDDATALDGLRRLQASLRKLDEGTAEIPEVSGLRRAFETLAQVMLASADELLSPTSRSTWTTSSAF